MSVHGLSKKCIDGKSDTSHVLLSVITDKSISEKSFHQENVDVALQIQAAEKLPASPWGGSELLLLLIERSRLRTFTRLVRTSCEVTSGSSKWLHPCITILNPLTLKNWSIENLATATRWDFNHLNKLHLQPLLLKPSASGCSRQLWEKAPLETSCLLCLWAGCCCCELHCSLWLQTNEICSKPHENVTFHFVFKYVSVWNNFSSTSCAEPQSK